MNTKLLKQKILDLAIRGKLVPQDPNDEPASELLKRIRAEKEKLIAEGKIKRSKKTGDKPHYENENVPFEIPASWEWVKLNDIAISELGKTLDKCKNSGKPYDYLCALNVKWGAFDLTIVKQILLEDKERERYLVRKGDLLICEGGDVGRAAIWEKNEEIYYQNALHRVRFKRDINQYFYLYALQYYKHLGLIDDVSGGVTIKHFTQNSMQKLLFPLPPLKEQKRIASEIEQWMALIDEIETDKQSMQEFIKQAKSKILDFAIHGKLVLQDPNDEPAIELLKRINPAIKPCDTSHYENLPKGWSIVKLGNIGKWQAGGTPNRGVKEYYGGNIPWLKTGDLNDGLINKIPECITQAGLDNSSAKLNPKDSVLIAMYGATIGKIGILTFPAATNQACCACVDYPILEKMYLFYFLLSHRDAFIMQGGGGAQPNISKEIILNTEIPLPPINEQKRIADMITEVFSFLDKISADL